jgi:hypothetical protein
MLVVAAPQSIGFVMDVGEHCPLHGRRKTGASGYGHELLRHAPNLGPVAPESALSFWVCEILSSSSARFDRAEKMPVYACNQVP